ncbi:SDR family oxidoreductase [bacterium]|nr:SDR family oxidoreductase [bacterium]
MLSQRFDLTGKVALVTGGSKGLGLAMARGLAEAGADIVIASRHEKELIPALEQILQGTGRRGRWFVADLTQRAAAQQLADQALQAFGQIDILINNAGSNTPQSIEDIDDATWDRLVELNLSSCMALTRALVPSMKTNGWGRVIYISSIMGFVSTAGRSAYSATKAALVGMAKAQALDLGAYGITVNCLAPGPFLTDLPKSCFSPEQLAKLAAGTALGRWADPEELVGPALLLASNAGSYITGETLLVDGGVVGKAF